MQKYDNGLTRLPPWYRQPIPDVHKIRQMKQMFRRSQLHTVCESAHCPNMGQCWGQGVATFMILGEICTRACRFCHIKAGVPQEVNPVEPQEVAEAVKALKLRYVVITSVARDDLPDEGVGQFIETIRAIRTTTPHVKVEVLIPDFSARIDCLEKLADEAPEVISHNMETVRRLAPLVRPQAQHERSLEVLNRIRQLNSNIRVKSSLMVGLGETNEEISETMQELKEAGCQILTIGQYLAPTRGKRHLKVERYATPQEFEMYKQKGLEIGLDHVMSGPLVRSSYLAEQGYQECQQKK